MPEEKGVGMTELNVNEGVSWGKNKEGDGG